MPKLTFLVDHDKNRHSPPNGPTQSYRVWRRVLGVEVRMEVLVNVKKQHRWQAATTMTTNTLLLYICPPCLDSCRREDFLYFSIVIQTVRVKKLNILSHAAVGAQQQLAAVFNCKKRIARGLLTECLLLHALTIAMRLVTITLWYPSTVLTRIEAQEERQWPWHSCRIEH